MVGGGGDGGTGDQGLVDDDDEMSELMSNRDFLRSVLSSLPGVNPEEAMQNLEEMTYQQLGEEEEGDANGECSAHSDPL